MMVAPEAACADPCGASFHSLHSAREPEMAHGERLGYGEFARTRIRWSGPLAAVRSGA